MITLKIALRNIFRHKSRSMITLSMICFGGMALIFAGGFFEDIYYKMRESYIQAHTGHIQIVRKGFFEKGAVEPFRFMIDDPQEVAGLVSKIPGVKFVTPRLQFSGLMSTGDNTISFVGQGIDPRYETANNAYSSDLRKSTQRLTMGGVLVTKGEPLTSKDTYSAVLGQGLADNIGVKPGDAVVLLTNTVNGSVNALDVGVKGMFYTSSKVYDDNVLRLPLTTAQKLLGTDSAQTLVVMLSRTEDTARIRGEMERIFRDRKMPLEMKSWNEISDFYVKTVKLFNKFFLVMKIVIIIVVILSIFNTMNMAVLERVSEIGTIMALGTKRSGVMNLFMLEGLCLGAIGGLLGIILGAVATQFIARVGIPMPPPPGATMFWLSEPKIVWGMLVFSLMLSLTTAIISSWYPAFKASRLEIAEALRHK